MTATEFTIAEMGGPSRRTDYLAAFVVNGIPQPKGSMTAIVVGGRARLIPGYNQKRKDGTRSDGRQRYERWCMSVAAAATARQILRPRTIIDEEPLAVEIWFYMPRPASAPKRVQFPIRKPDIDKLTRAVLDCLTKSGIITDDARIVDLLVRKRFSDKPRAEIFILKADT